MSCEGAHAGVGPCWRGDGTSAAGGWTPRGPKRRNATFCLRNQHLTYRADAARLVQRPPSTAFDLLSSQLLFSHEPFCVLSIAFPVMVAPSVRDTSSSINNFGDAISSAASAALRFLGGRNSPSSPRRQYIRIGASSNSAALHDPPAALVVSNLFFFWERKSRRQKQYHRKQRNFILNTVNVYCFYCLPMLFRLLQCPPFRQACGRRRADERS